MAANPGYAPQPQAMDCGSTKARLLIKGITENGQLFRPSDWAQRLATAAAACRPGGRLRSHPMVRVVIADGVPSVVVDQQLASSDPRLYAFLRDFGANNGLQLLET
ncbi:MAG: DUF3579 domain-containing protein [Thiohalomonadaceae bacterium]